MPRRHHGVLVVFAVSVALAPVTAALAAASAPLDPYPQSQPQPLGTSRVPAFLDDDETLRAKMAPDGSLVSFADDVILKLRGSGDYAIFLPGHATAVRDLGGDTPPGLQDGHVSFLGFLTGQAQLDAEATLDDSAASTMPLAAHITYAVGNKQVGAAAVPGTTGLVRLGITLTNLTRQPVQFARGNPSPGPLATVLEAMRQAAALYTPETDLGAVLPRPASLPMAGATTTEQHDTYVPLALTVDVRLPAGTEVTDAPGADVTVEPGGTRARWTARLPAGVDADGAVTLGLAFRAPHPRVPSIEVKAEAAPLPAAGFTPPGGGAWAPYLARLRDRAAAGLLAQEGAASLHRIGDLVPPLGRPGPGPVKVKYDLLLDSGPATVTVPPPPRTVPRGQGWAIVLVTALGAYALVAGVSAWARH